MGRITVASLIFDLLSKSPQEEVRGIGNYSEFNFLHFCPRLPFPVFLFSDSFSWFPFSRTSLMRHPLLSDSLVHVRKIVCQMCRHESPPSPTACGWLDKRGFILNSSFNLLHCHLILFSSFLTCRSTNLGWDSEQCTTTFVCVQYWRSSKNALMRDGTPLCLLWIKWKLFLRATARLSRFVLEFAVLLFDFRIS